MIVEDISIFVPNAAKLRDALKFINRRLCENASALPKRAGTTRVFIFRKTIKSRGGYQAIYKTYLKRIKED